MARGKARGKKQKKSSISPSERKAIKKEIKAVVSKEVEVKDVTAYFTATVSNVLVPVDTSALSAGYTDGTRIADEIHLSSMSIRYHFEMGTNVLLPTDNYNRFRVYSFRWMADNASDPPTLATIFNVTAGDPSLWSWNHEYRHKYHVIYDKCFLLSSRINGFDGTKTILPDGYAALKKFSAKGKKLGNKKVNFNPSATTGTGHIYCGALSDSNSTPHPTFEGQIQILYTDA